MVRASLYRTVNGFRETSLHACAPRGLAYRARLVRCVHARPVLLGNVDELLPNPESILSSMDTDYIRGQLNVAMGRPQAHVCSNLLLYESLYRVVYALTQERVVGRIAARVDDRRKRCSSTPCFARSGRTCC